jgi:hypothetical protein
MSTAEAEAASELSNELTGLREPYCRRADRFAAAALRGAAFSFQAWKRLLK